MYWVNRADVTTTSRSPAFDLGSASGTLRSSERSSAVSTRRLKLSNSGELRSRGRARLILISSNSRPGRGRITSTRSRQHHGLVDVVRHQHQRRPRIGPEVEQMVLQVAPGEGIERGERLVQQQHFRLRHQRAGDRHPLRLAAGQFARPGIGLVGKPDPRQCARRPSRA